LYVAVVAGFVPHTMTNVNAISSAPHLPTAASATSLGLLKLRLKQAARFSLRRQRTLKFAVGYLLDELKNDITRENPASFEPIV
jgi:hypothetical protein